MFAGFSPNKSKALVVEATQARVLRQNLIASNIANIDTPFYRAKDVARWAYGKKRCKHRGFRYRN